MNLVLNPLIRPAIFSRKVPTWRLHGVHLNGYNGALEVQAKTIFWMVFLYWSYDLRDWLGFIRGSGFWRMDQNNSLVNSSYIDIPIPSPQHSMSSSYGWRRCHFQRATAQIRPWLKSTGKEKHPTTCHNNITQSYESMMINRIKVQPHTCVGEMVCKYQVSQRTVFESSDS